MYFLYLVFGVGFLIAMRLLRVFTTKMLYKKFQIVCKFKGLFGIQEFSLVKPIKDLLNKKMRLTITNMRIKYLKGFKFQIEVENIDCSITIALIRIEVVKSFISNEEKVAGFLHNVLQLRGTLKRLCEHK